MDYKPTQVGLVGGLLPKDAPLGQGICPECPWRKEMTPGFSTAMAQDYSMMAVALTRSNRTAWTENSNGRKYDFRPYPVENSPYDPNDPTKPCSDVSQTCHMRLDQRCAGAEAFRANTGLSSEVSPNDKITSSIEEMISVWRSRGSKI